jgi:type IV pilus assembly protein PilQ
MIAKRHLIRCLGPLVVLAAVMLPHAAPAEPGPHTISMHFVDTEISAVLATLAAQVGIDLVLGPGIEGPININLNEVDWKTALNVIVGANGLTYHWTDNVLVILAAGMSGGGELLHRVIPLKYADPASVKTALANVLSTVGRIEILGGGTGSSTGNASVLIVSELAFRMPGIEELIKSLDVPRPQFEIAVKFVETDIDDDLGYGFNWPTKLSASVGIVDETEGSTTTQTSVSSVERELPDHNEWRVGKLSISQLSGFLEFLQQNGESKLLSDPRVTVLENETANMKVTTTFPIQTLSRFTEGAVIQDIVDFQDLEVGITLKVTPRLNDSATITLDVEPIVEEITGYTGPADNQRPITARRTVKTMVRVDDNETIVLGGLVREIKVVNENGVFLLSEIPLLGSLFKHKQVETKKTDLLIFITPRIIDELAGT